MLREFSIDKVTDDYLIFKTPTLHDNNLRVWVLYDTGPDQTGLPDYVAWKTVSDNGFVKIDSSSIYKPTAGSFRYLDFLPNNFVIVTTFEARVLEQLVLRGDLVRSRYPERFMKKFSLEEYVLCIEAAVADIDLYPPMTNYWFRFESVATEDANYNPLQAPIAGAIPYHWLQLVSVGALLNMLVAQGILEVDVNFTVNDGGVTITYNNAEGIKGWWTSLIEEYNKQKKMIKSWELKPQAVGTFPFGAGIPTIISTLLGPVAATGWPWYQYMMQGRPA